MTDADPTVVLCGDSHLDSIDWWDTVRLPQRLRAHGFEVAELAVGGLNSAEAVERYPSLPAGRRVVSLGSNDAGPVKHVPLDDFRRNITVICEVAGADAIWLTPPPVHEERPEHRRGNQAMRTYAGTVAEVAGAQGAVVIPVFDRFTDLMLEGVDLHVEDGLHLNDRAYDEIEALLLPFLR